MKSKRQAEILRIIEEVDVETQDQLLAELRERGFTSTQATISRDIKELHLVKTIFKEGVTSFDRAQNIVVLRTMPGLASAACAAIDGMEIGDLVGSLAGDDTAILIMRDNEKAAAFCDEIHKMLQ